MRSKDGKGFGAEDRLGIVKFMMSHFLVSWPRKLNQYVRYRTSKVVVFVQRLKGFPSLPHVRLLTG